MKTPIIVFIFIFLNQCGFAQDSLIIKTDSNSKNNLKESYPIFLPHFALGLASGGRIGCMVRFSARFMGELSYGANVRTLMIREETLYSAGISYFLIPTTPVFLNALFVFGKPNPVFDRNKAYYYFSLNFGYLGYTKNDLFFFARTGIINQYSPNGSSGSYSISDTFFNLDIGFGYAF